MLTRSIDKLPGTRNVSWYAANIDGAPFYILDTPGFDDSVLSDSEVLHMLINELATIHRDHRKLAGLVYLHDISRVRVGGTSYRVRGSSHHQDTGWDAAES